jgi:hypothetical protein
MVLAALVVAIISALLAGVGLVYNRRSTRASEKSAADADRAADAANRPADAAARSADAAAVTAGLDTDRRHAEWTPRFRITCEPRDDGGLRMVIFLYGPPDLERLDALTAVIRDDPRGAATARRLPAARP